MRLNRPKPPFAPDPELFYSVVGNKLFYTDWTATGRGTDEVEIGTITPYTKVDAKNIAELVGMKGVGLGDIVTFTNDDPTVDEHTVYGLKIDSYNIIFFTLDKV